jgi:hypothetical protein
MNRIKRASMLSAVAAMLACAASAQSVSTTVTGTPGNYSRDTSVTGPNGKTATYQNNATWGNSSYTDDRTATTLAVRPRLRAPLPRMLRAALPGKRQSLASMANPPPTKTIGIGGTVRIQTRNPIPV